MKKTPRIKKLRALGTDLPGLSRKRPRKEAARPGQHGRRPRRKESEYAKQLREKQKVRLHYGLTETQLRRYFEQAARTSGVTGENMFALLERRLSNVVFRLGFAPTIPAARQLISHGHVKVQGKKVDRASYLVSEGELIELKSKAYDIPDVLAAIDRGPQVTLPTFLLTAEDGKVGRVVGPPMRSDVPLIVDDAAVVEFYAR